MSAAASSPPREIKGSAGSRIRVIFGDTADEYLILLDNDGGDCEWQSQYWSGIPPGLARQINNCNNKGRYVTEVDFDSSSDMWFAAGEKRDGSGSHCWWDVSRHCGDDISAALSDSSDLKVAIGYYGGVSCVVVTGENGYRYNNVARGLQKQLKKINDRGDAIRLIRLFDGGEYYIQDGNGGAEWIIDGKHLRDELQRLNDVLDLAKAQDGSWLIVGDNDYSCSTGVPDDVTSVLDDFYAEQKSRNAQRAHEIQSYREAVEQRRAQEEADRRRQEEADRRRQEEEAAERVRQEEELRRQRREEGARLRQQAEEQRKEDTLLLEAVDIAHLEQTIEHRKRALMENAADLPPARRARIEARGSPRTTAALVAASLSSSSSSSIHQRSECVICHDVEAELAIVPCGHLCLCSECAPRLVQARTDERCPICRRVIESTLKVFMH